MSATSKMEVIRDSIDFHTNYLNELKRLHNDAVTYAALLERAGINFNLDKFADYKKQLELNSLLTICILDLAVSTKGLLTAQLVWEEMFHLRQGYLTIHSFLKTYGHYSKWLSKDTSTSAHFDRIKVTLKDFRKNYESSAEIMRNKTTAHIDSDFNNYFQLISAFDRELALKAFQEFVDILNDLQRLSTLKANNKVEIEQQNGSLSNQLETLLKILQRDLHAK